MTDENIPLPARWSLYALGTVEGSRIRQAADPVAAWLLRNHAELAGEAPPPITVATTRLRTATIDRMFGEEAHRARHLGQKLAVWTLGGGFDSRWYRLHPALDGILDEVGEVEEPGLLQLKNRLLVESPYSMAWFKVSKRALTRQRWGVHDYDDDIQPLIVLETLTERLPGEAAAALLQQLRETSPRARVLAQLPGRTASELATWSTKKLHQWGWQITDEVRKAARVGLRTDAGRHIVPPTAHVRLLRLATR